MKNRRFQKMPFLKNRLLIQKLSFYALSLLFLMLVGCNSGKDFSYKGLPKAQAFWHTSTWHSTLKNKGFILGYSERRGNPLWVSYRLQAIPADAQHWSRPHNFKIDKRSKKISPKAYERSGYDRGHLAPNYAISRLYGKEAQLETFMMSNISPQKPNLNRKLWERLEEVEINFFTQLSPTVWVTAGPIFDNNIVYLNNQKEIEIPDAFYKVYADVSNDGKTHLLGFMMPQDVKGNEVLSDYVVSVDKIEALTGLDFFHELEDKEENALEAAIETQSWQLEQVSRLPSRY